MSLPDIVIAGAGLIGLACALELERRGMRVTVLERGQAARQASWAAAGMLAAHDPANPSELQQLANLSISLYPAFLENVRERSGMNIPFETEWILERGIPERQELAFPSGFEKDGFGYAHEQSLDPRKLSTALAKAARASAVELRENAQVERVQASPNGAIVDTARERIACGAYLDCTGAWCAGLTHPAKGQMLRVHAPGALAVAGIGNVVVRTEEVYLVPRLDGSIVIGATLENAGFDRSVHEDDMRELRERAARLLPSMAGAPEAERWAGLRPDTPDHLPFIGATDDRTFVAAGHFRNGVLLAPATAYVMAQLLSGEAPSADLAAFGPRRFAGQTYEPHGHGTVFEHA